MGKVYTLFQKLEEHKTSVFMLLNFEELKISRWEICKDHARMTHKAIFLKDNQELPEILKRFKEEPPFAFKV